MAQVKYQPCAVCSTKFPVRPQAPHAKFCSTKCRMQHHRQEKKINIPTTMTEEQKMTEETPQVPMQFVFSHEEYRRRCQDNKSLYENRFDDPVLGVIGAIIRLELQGTLDAAFETYHQYRDAGYSPQPQMCGLPTASIVETSMIQLTSLYLMKPPRQQEKDLETLCAKVKADYEAELAAALDAETERQVALIIATKERQVAQQQKLEAERAEQAARDELAASREALRKKLIASGKLNADGSAA